MKAWRGMALFPPGSVHAGVVTKWLRQSEAAGFQECFSLPAARRLTARLHASIWREGVDCGCHAERETILYLTQTWEPKHGFTNLFFSQMFDTDQHLVEACPPASWGRWRDRQLHAKTVTLKKQQYSFYETFISRCDSALEQG